MKFETKYDYNQQIYSITAVRQKDWYICTFCLGSGKIKGQDKTERTCPVCYGSLGEYKYLKSSWVVHDPITVGAIKINAQCKHENSAKIVKPQYANQVASYIESYMCYETGIGSGQIWYLDQLFETASQAQAECDKRNKIGQES